MRWREVRSTWSNSWRDKVNWPIEWKKKKKILFTWSSGQVNEHMKRAVKVNWTTNCFILTEHQDEQFSSSRRNTWRVISRQFNDETWWLTQVYKEIPETTEIKVTETIVFFAITYYCVMNIVFINFNRDDELNGKDHSFAWDRDRDRQCEVICMSFNLFHCSFICSLKYHSRQLINAWLAPINLSTQTESPTIDEFLCKLHESSLKD